jgi:hypothetical protein
MNQRTLLLGLAILLGLVGIGISVRDIIYQPPPPPPRMVALAARDIGTYVIVDADMVQAVEKPGEEAVGIYGAEDVVGKITTRYIKAGEPIDRYSVLSIEEFRFASDMGLEIASFPARFDEMVGGQLKPGHHINIYGYREGGADRLSETMLIAPDVWVVDVRTASGGEAGIPTPTPGGGGLFSPIGGQRAVPASIVTVAAEPSVVWKIVDTLGARGFNAWVTIAGRGTWVSTPAPATPTSTPIPSTPTPGPMPDLVVVNITTDPSPIVKDQMGTVQVEVKNQGSAEMATTNWVGLYMDRVAEGDPDKQMFCPPLGVDESATVSYSVTLPDVGYHALTAWADWLEAIPEENEANNQYSASILVSEPTPTPMPTATPTPIPPTATPTSGAAIPTPAQLPTTGGK